MVNEEVVEDFAAQLDDGGGGCGCGVVSDSGAKPVPKVNGKYHIIFLKYDDFS